MTIDKIDWRGVVRVAARLMTVSLHLSGFDPIVTS
jgi:hypothetical protein